MMPASISAIEPDWSRERPRGLWDPGRRLLRSIRGYQRHRGRNSFYSRIAKRYFVIEHLFWSTVTGCEIPLNCELGGGLLLTHPNGVIIHADAKIGPNCLIFHQVTIGLGKDGVPIIGGHVDIASGARIVGGIRIGDHAVIGLNAVVLSDVPAGGVAVGVPARIVRIERVTDN